MMEAAVAIALTNAAINLFEQITNLVQKSDLSEPTKEAIVARIRAALEKVPMEEIK